MKEHASTVRDVTADSFVRAYLELIGEGHSPDLEEFIHRVPEDLRDEVYRCIDEALANPPEVADNVFLEPSVEVNAAAVPQATRRERAMLFLVPGSIRENFTVEWLLARREGTRALGEWLQALAQYAPLREASLGKEPDPVAKRGWFAWRLAGPALFLGVVFGLPVVVLGGALALGLAITAATSRRDGDDEASRRLVNALLGGTTVGLAAVLGLGVLAILTIVVSAATGWTVLAAFAMKALAIAATFVVAVVTGSGWSPEPWWPKHLVRQD